MKRTQYFKWGLTAFLTVCAVLVFYDTFYQAGTLQQFVSKLASILAPVLYGFAIAYLLTPIMSCLERAIAALWKKRGHRSVGTHAPWWFRIVDTLETQHPTYTSIQFLLSKAIGK